MDARLVAEPEGTTQSMLEEEEGPLSGLTEEGRSVFLFCSSAWEVLGDSGGFASFLRCSTCCRCRE